MALIHAGAIAGQFLETFKEYPPSQATGSLRVTQFIQAIRQALRVAERA